MKLSLTDDQTAQRDALERLFAEAAPVGAAPAEVAAAKARAWNDLVQMGWLALAVAEARGGAGGSGDARARFVSAAKAGVGRAARYVAETAVQLHGGVGFMEMGIDWDRIEDLKPRAPSPKTDISAPGRRRRRTE